MTLVNHDTGEITETLTEDAARRLTDRIRLLADTLADTLDKMADLIDQARTGSAWLALGYRSWTEYVATEFAGVLPRLEREPRQEFVRELSARGMSTRAIAPVVNVSHQSVANDLTAPVKNLTPETPEAGATDDRRQQTAVEAAPSVPHPPVTGIDGKTYPRPEPAAVVAEYVEDGAEVRLTSWRKSFMAAIARSGELMLYTPADVAEKADAELVAELERLSHDLNNYVSRVRAKRPTRLTAIRGGAE